jgi:hypothetical protein
MPQINAEDGTAHYFAPEGAIMLSLAAFRALWSLRHPYCHASPSISNLDVRGAIFAPKQKGASHV